MMQLGEWQFDFTHPAIMLLSVALLVSLLLTLAAVGRRLWHRKPRRALVTMFLNLLAFCTLLVLLLDPHHLHPAEQSVTLITEGADSSGRPGPMASSLYVAPGVIHSNEAKQDYGNAAWLLDIEQLQLREPALTSIEILGYGLSQDQWQNFDNDLGIDFNPPAVNGFSTMQWQRTLRMGEPLNISGRFQQGDTRGLIELRLLDPASNVINETRIKNGQSFKLTGMVKARGQLEYKLQAWSADQLLSEQLVALDAGSTIPIRIMIEQSAPSFEIRQLKNYTALEGHRILINTQISKDKTIRQMANLPDESHNTFSAQTLAMQDVLLMDGRALSQLSAGQITWLIEAIENGLGLLILADTDLLKHFPTLNSDLLNGFQLSANTGAEAVVLPRLLTRQQQEWHTPLETRPMNLTADNADILIDDGAGRGLVVKRSRGLGNIAISLINSTHSWLTSGQRAQWSMYWAELLTNMARQADHPVLLAQADTEFHRLNRKVEVCAFSAVKDTRLMITSPDSRGEEDVIEVPLSSDLLGSSRRCGYFWPHSSGWHQVRLMTTTDKPVMDEKAVYVFADNQWPGQDRNERVRASQVKAASSIATKSTVAQKWASEPVNQFWLWLTLVMSASLLWLERKLDFG